jgi:hypothetical protein
MRFVYCNKGALATGRAMVADHEQHLVIDTQPPGGRVGEASPLCIAPNAEAAAMICLALNGVSTTVAGN